jgi:ADP-ribose pyrophosphatase YjhB (NUDIX family)
MYITENEITQLAGRFGEPMRKSFTVPSSSREIEFIKSTRRDGRYHDFTLYIFHEDKVIVNAKHFYPPGLYRAPSGGVNKGEDIICGIMREAMEETGCKIELQRFLLRTEVDFAGDTDHVKWRSFVLQAKYLSGDFRFTDHDEIREVRLAPLEQFDQFSRLMLATGRAGFHYRAALHETVAPLLIPPTAGPGPGVSTT